LVIVEALVVGRAQLAAIDQAAGRLIDHHQFHAALLETVAQLLEALVAGLGGAELGAQIFHAAEQPALVGIHEGDEVLHVAGGVAAGIVRSRAQRAAVFHLVLRRLAFFGLQRATECGAGHCQGQGLEFVCSHGRPRQLVIGSGSIGSISTGRRWRTMRSRISSCFSPRMPASWMPLLLRGASIFTRYSSTDSGESMLIGLEPLPARV